MKRRARLLLAWTALFVPACSGDGLFQTVQSFYDRYGCRTEDDCPYTCPGLACDATSGECSCVFAKGGACMSNYECQTSSFSAQCVSGFCCPAPSSLSCTALNTTCRCLQTRNPSAPGSGK